MIDAAEEAEKLLRDGFVSFKRERNLVATRNYDSGNFSRRDAVNVGQSDDGFSRLFLRGAVGALFT